MACDAVGVSEYYTMKYVHVHNYSANKGHVFAKLINKKTGKEVKKELVLKNHSEVMYDYKLIPKDQIRNDD